MTFLTLFDVFLLSLSFYSIAAFTGVTKYTVPLACLFCIFWVQKLEKRMKEDEEAKRKLLEHRLKKHNELRERSLRRGHPATGSEE